MERHHPITIKFTRQDLSIQDKVLNLPIQLRWNQMVEALNDIFKIGHDYVVVGIDPELQQTMTEQEARSIDFISGYIANTSSKQRKVPTYSYYRKNQTFYRLDPYYGKDAVDYAPSDVDVMNRVFEYGYDITDSESNNRQWQAHQASVFKRLKALMPLTDGTDKYKATNHKQELLSPKRGLEEEDIQDMFSWESNKILNPLLLQDDLIGIPGIRAKQTEDILYLDGKIIGRNPIQVLTTGLSGYVIPMCNADGNMTKFQCGTDISIINVSLKARAADGVSIKRDEYYTKNSPYSRNGEYLFETNNGEPTHLVILRANDNEITLQDYLGEFHVQLKENILDVLESRNYNIPPLMARLSPEVSAKYIWTSKGNFIGSDVINKAISPNDAGFIKVTDGNTYKVLVVEGALKGKIVAKYLQVPDANGVTLGEHLGQGDGLIVAQVPGVAKAFVESVRHIYSNYPVHQVIVAMDADGRENKSVAQGIHESYTLLGDPGRPVTVMSWDSELKGLDDALLAISRGELTLNQLGLQFGTAEDLFPLDEAKSPNPYKLDGTRANKESWRLEDDERQKETKEKIKQAQENALPTTVQDEKKADLVTTVSESLGSLLATKEQWHTLIETYPELKPSFQSLKDSLTELQDMNEYEQ